jgi:hypothetical protein
MAKIGRNQKCPCGSGKKFKQCCSSRWEGLLTGAPPLQGPRKMTLMSGVDAICEHAEAGRAYSMELGVFFFFSTGSGDAWLLEMTACDCVQLARGGEVLDVPVDENSDTIEINWSHSYKVADKQLELIAYGENISESIKNAPVAKIRAATRSIRKRFSKEQLDKVHLPGPDDAVLG